jgi:hypothetical protein
MGYSRVNSQLLSRALCTWTFTGFANAGSTCSPVPRQHHVDQIG